MYYCTIFSCTVPVLQIFPVLCTVNTHVQLKIVELLEVDMVHKDVIKGGGLWGLSSPWTSEIYGFQGVFRPQTGAMEKFLTMPETVQYKFKDPKKKKYCFFM